MKYSEITSDKYNMMSDAVKTDGSYVVTTRGGATIYCVNGQTHRDDGPAYFYNGHSTWYLHGKKISKPWFIDHPDKITKMQAWELFTPDEIIRMRLTA
jgi:hypothetical protein